MTTRFTRLPNEDRSRLDAAPPGRRPPAALLDWLRGRADGEDGGGRPALVALRRGRPRAPPLYGRSRADRRSREGDSPHEVALRRAPRAALARRASPPPGKRRARDGHGRPPRRLAPARTRGSAPSRRRARRRGGRPASLRRAGGEPAR